MDWNGSENAMIARPARRPSSSRGSLCRSRTTRRESRECRHYESQDDRGPVGTVGFKIVVHDDYSFCFTRAFIRSATATGSIPVAAAMARTCFARLSI